MESGVQGLALVLVGTLCIRAAEPQTPPLVDVSR
jgi:hypothetical protein